MEQLSSLDAQFLGVESARTYGHVGMLAVYDPSTAPGGRLEAADLCRLIARRIHLLPPLRRRLVDVPLGLDLPYWIEDPDFDLDFHVRETAVPPPGDDHRLAETVARIFARPLDRSRPLWELYLIHGLPDGRIGLLTQGPPRRGGRDLGQRDPRHPARPDARGARHRAAAANGASAASRVPGQLDMLARGLLGRAAASVARRQGAAEAARDARGPGANALPRRAAAQPRARAAAGRPAHARDRAPARGHDRAAAAHLLQRPDLGASPVRVRLALARPRQGASRMRPARPSTT